MTTPPPAPIRRLRTQARATAAVSVIALTACAWWALSPLEYEPISSITLREPAPETADDALQPLNLAAFNAVIWRSPPTSVANQLKNKPTPPPALRLNVQLVAITSDTSAADIGVTRRAAVYDPDKNRLLLLAEGDTVGRFTLTAIDAGSVTFTSGAHVATLKLRSDEPQLRLGRADR